MQFFKKLLFTDVTSLVKQGKVTPLQAKDMPALPREIDPRSFSPAFKDLSLMGPWSFLWTVTKAVKKEAIIMFVLMLFLGTIEVLSPYLLHELVQNIELAFSGVKGIEVGIGLAVLFTVLTLVRAIGLQHYFYHILKSEQQIVNGLNYRIFKKTLKLSRDSKMKKPVGDVVNLMGTDSDTVSEIVGVGVEVVYTLFIFVGVSIMLFKYLGIAALASLGVFVLLLPVTKYLSERFVKLDEALMTKRDERVSVTSQVISAIRIVKYFAWEKLQLRKIAGLRDSELQSRKELVYAESLSRLVYLGARTFASLAGFGTFLYLGGELTAPVAFAAIALFMVIEDPFGNLSGWISMISSARVSSGRIIDYLTLDEHHLDGQSGQMQDGLPVGIELSNVRAQYEDSNTPVIKELSLSIDKGESVAIVGPVGAGKSTLMSLILGEMPITGGAIGFPGVARGERPRFGWTPQETFVRNMSLRENILFGESEDLLQEAIEASRLSEDIRQIHDGLEAEIGEQGINLSGGQKQRLSLARCFVRKPGVVLLDDPLSAVDAHTETELVNRLIFGKWRHKTRVVVTHRLKYLHKFETVVFMEQGRIVAKGNLLECLQNPRFRSFFKEHDESDSGKVDLKGATKEKVTPAAEKQNGAPTALVSEEDREMGAISPMLYLDYLKSMIGKHPRKKAYWAAGLALSSLAISFTPLLQNTWISHWTGGGDSIAWFKGINLAQEQNVMVFAAISLLVLVAYLAQRLVWGLGSINAGRILHDGSLDSVLHTKVRFFDTTPVGRVLNRFSRDLDMVERNLPWAFESMIRNGLSALTAVLVLLVTVPQVVPIVLPVFWVYYKLQKDYRASSREAKRLTSITNSPRFAHFKETIEGHSVIRAYEQKDDYWKKFFDTLSENQKMFHGMIVLNRWFSVRIPLLSSVVVLSVIVGLLLLAQAGLVSGGLAGMVMLYALSLTGKLDQSIRSFSEAEARMTSLERLETYSQLESEPTVVKVRSMNDRSGAYVSNASVEFEDVVASYAENLPPVLKGVSFSIESGQKVALIGRTGSGKSTVFQTIFRFINLTSGSIKIGGADIAAIPLERLRRMVAIIPQDPTLLKGSLRENLDPFGQHSDESLWNALERAHIKRLFLGHEKGLNAEVSENGHNFSQGQRQLLCLARALLADSPIIAMDEATASVDVESDALIQQTIREEFHDKTVLIIAHRLETVQHCDQVLELQGGLLVERDAKKLQTKENSPRVQVVNQGQLLSLLK